MNYIRDWSDSRNAVGFAAECARLALPFYHGDRKQDLVAAITVAEKYAAGEQTTGVRVARTGAHGAAGAAARAGSTSRSGPAALAADAASYAADAASYADAHVAKSRPGYSAPYYNERAATVSGDAAYAAAGAGVDGHELDTAYARWVVRDLSPRWPIDQELRQAAGAAVVAGDEDLARELVNTEPS